MAKNRIVQFAKSKRLLFLPLFFSISTSSLLMSGRAQAQEEVPISAIAQAQEEVPISAIEIIRIFMERSTDRVWLGPRQYCKGPQVLKEGTTFYQIKIPFTSKLPLISFNEDHSVNGPPYTYWKTATCMKNEEKNEE